MEDSPGQIVEVLINNKKSDAAVTKLAVKYLVGDKPFRIVVKSQMNLPRGQGFGMSGAGALSTTIALGEILEISKDVCLKAAHFAEVQLKTGLGDVIASSFGGIEIRREPGLPPWGIIEHIPGNYDVVLCVTGKKIDTKKILSNQIQSKGIVTHGRFCTKKLLESPSLENLFSLSQYFSKKTNLAMDKTLRAVEAVQNYGAASMCMLGNSVFAVGKTDELCKILSNFGKVFVCKIDEIGARRLEI